MEHDNGLLVYYLLNPDRYVWTREVSTNLTVCQGREETVANKEVLMRGHFTRKLFASRQKIHVYL